MRIYIYIVYLSMYLVPLSAIVKAASQCHSLDHSVKINAQLS